MRNKKGQFIKGHNVPKKWRNEWSIQKKGKKKSKEFIEKLRKVRTGWKFSEETKKKISEKLRGNKNSLGHKHKPNQRSIDALIRHTKKNGVWNKGMIGYGKGHIVSKETRQKISEAQLGEKHHAWIKDRSIVERNKRNDPAYQQWVKAVVKRDKNECRLKDKNCFGKKIAHHIRSWAEYIKLRYVVSNGVILCEYHHPRTRKREKEMVSILENLIKI